MSLQYIDSFDGYTSAEITNYWKIDNIVFSPSIVSTPTHFGTQAIRVFANGIQHQGDKAAAQHFVIGFAVFPEAYQRVATLKSINDGTATGTTTIATFDLDADGVFSITRQIGGVAKVARSDPKHAIVANKTYYYVEWESTITNAGLNQIWIDGLKVYSSNISMVGTNTKISAINAYELNGGGISQTNMFDDFYFYADNGGGVKEYGDSGVGCLFPTADGSFTEWTPNSGTVHFNRVNEKPADGDTTYNLSSSTGQRDTFKVSTSVILNTDKIGGAELVQLCRNDGTTGTLLAVDFIVVNGATNTGAFSTPFVAPTATYINNSSPVFTMYELNPLTTATWTGSEINQTEWGIEQV